MATIQENKLPFYAQRLAVVLVIFFFTIALPWFIVEKVVDQDEDSSADRPATEAARTDDNISTTNNDDLDEGSSATGSDTAEVAGESTQSDSAEGVKIVSQPPELAIIDDSYRYQIELSKTDLAVVEFSLPQAPGWLKLNSETGILSGTPAEEDFGRNKVTIGISYQGETTEQSFTINVTSPTSAQNSDFRDPFATSANPNGSGSGEVLGASTEDLPDTAYLPYQWVIMGGLLIISGLIVRFYFRYWIGNHRSTHQLSSGGTLTVTERKKV